MIKKFFTILFFLTNMFLFATEEIEVSLETKNPLMPLYNSQFTYEKSSFSKDYQNQLKEIFDFDLNMSGLLKIIKNEKVKDKQLSLFNFESCFENAFWQNQKIAFVIKNELIDKKLKSYIYNVEKSYLKSFETSLSGNVFEDRKKLHELTDNIVESFFGTKGIASSKIIYTVRSENSDPAINQNWISEIWICDYDGKNAKQITNSKNYFVHPIFVPNNNNILDEYLYVSYVTGQPKIHIAKINGFETSPFIDLRGNQLLPAISNNFDKIAFISDAAGRPDIFMHAIDKNRKPIGKPIQLFSYPRATQASPCFSNDGSKLAFVSDKDGTPRIYIINITDAIITKKRPLAHLITKKNRQNVTPCWSKDGNKLAYSAKTDGVRQIWIYDFNEDMEWQLTRGPQNKENPIWAPNSMHIIYNTEDKNEAELYLININQKKPIKISSGKGRKRFPYFQQ
ncbi:MAG: Tol-Pal system protein TolB [Parachlamydiales bacterium]|nr:Tol-Pal system protein TolB [Parachlamydiales bacterium]